MMSTTSASTLLFIFCTTIAVMECMAVDPTSLNGKVMFGYQGWFGATGDGLPGYGYRHWALNSNTLPAKGNLAFDSFPNLSEYPPDCLFDTSLVYSNGDKVKLYSCYCLGVVDLHFKWLKDYNLDGVFLQRFVTEIQGGVTLQQRDQVSLNVKQSAEKYNRVFGIMYDVSGASSATLLDTLKSDWNHLVNDLKVTSSPQYIHQNGKPVVVIWGFGFTDHPPDTTDEAIQIINMFKSQFNVYIVGGVPYYWLDSNKDSKPGFLPVYQSFDAVSPWAVGRYSDNSSYDSLFANFVVRDKQFTTSHQIGYGPVIFPGFSWSNLQNKPSAINQIPRAKGGFFTHQAEKILTIHPSWVYLAMFDEVNEGTAFFKLASLKSGTPSNANFTYQSIDGEVMPSDAYLTLAAWLTSKV